MFVDYSFYTDSFAGTLVPAEEYPAAEAETERYLKYVTEGRYAEVTDAETIASVKRAICAGAEALYSFHQEYKDIPSGVASESTDGHSVTFVKSDALQADQMKKSLMFDAFLQELFDTGLLYQGVI